MIWSISYILKSLECKSCGGEQILVLTVGELYRQWTGLALFEAEVMQDWEDVSDNAWRAVLSQIEGPRDGGDS